MTTIEAIAETLADPTASHWLKAAIRDLLDRDMVDAANDADRLADLMDQRISG